MSIFASVFQLILEKELVGYRIFLIGTLEGGHSNKCCYDCDADVRNLPRPEVNPSRRYPLSD